MIDQAQLNTITGSYLPSFFKMEVRTDESFLEIQTLSRSTASVYFHEYIHYLQDISTFHGLSNIIRLGEYIHFCKKMIQAGKATFRVPILSDQLQSGVDVTVKIGKILNGSNLILSKDVNIEKITVRNSGIISSEGVDIPEVIVIYNGGEEYRFGAFAINESMAYIGEKYLFPESPLAAVFPYHSAELVTRQIFQEFANNKLNIFALCDIALMTAEPGPAFYRYLNRLKDDEFLPRSPKDVYQYFKDELYEFEGFKFLTRIQMLSSLGQIARHYLRGYFPFDLHNANVKWMDHVINHAVGLRNRNISFPLDILLYGTFYDNPELDLTMKNVGGPLQLNRDNQATFIIIEQLADELIQPDLNWVISDILKIMLGSTLPCGMKAFCKASAAKQGISDFTNEMCDKKPWQRANNNLDCSMTRMLKIWQIDQKMPTQLS